MITEIVLWLVMVHFSGHFLDSLRSDLLPWALVGEFAIAIGIVFLIENRFKKLT